MAEHLPSMSRTLDPSQLMPKCSYLILQFEYKTSPSGLSHLNNCFPNGGAVGKGCGVSRRWRLSGGGGS